MFIRLILAIGCFYFIGYPIYFIINHSKIHQQNKMNSTLLSFCLGIGALPLIFFYICWLGIQLSNRNLVFIFIPFIVLTIIMNYYSLKQNKNELKTKFIRNLLLLKDTKHRTLIVLMLLIILWAVIFSILFSLSKPIDTYDALFHWSYKAKILFHERSIYTPSFLYSSNRISRIQSHPNYPLLLPLLEFHISTFLGKFDDRWIKVILPIFFILLILFFWQMNYQFFHLNYSILATLFLVTLPVFYYQKRLLYILEYRNAIFGGNADLLVTFFYLAGSFYIFLWIKNGKISNIIIASLFHTFTAFAKNEGLGLLIMSYLSLIIVILIYFKGKRKRGILCWVIYVALTLILISPWLIHQSTLFDPAERYLQQLKINIILANLKRLPLIFVSLAIQFIKIHIWSILWILFFILIILNRKEKKDAGIKFLFLSYILNIMMFIGIFMITPWNLKKFLFKLNVLPRLLLQIAPVIVFLTFHQLYNLLDKKKYLEKST